MTRKKNCMVTLIVLIAFNAIYAEICDIGDYVPDVKGNPVGITEYTEKLRDAGGRLVGEERTISRRMTFDYVTRKIEVVNYNDTGKAFEYVLIKYLENKKISAITRKRIDDIEKNEIVYTSDNEWDEYRIMQDGSKAKTVSFSKDKENGKFVSYCTMLNEYITVKKSYLETGRENAQYTYWNDEIESLYSFEYSERKKKTTFYSSYGMNTVLEEIFDTTGNAVQSIYKQSDEERSTIKEYSYDTTGNWIQCDSFNNDSSFGGLYRVPETRLIREFSYKKSASEVLSIEPSNLVPEYEMTSTDSSLSNENDAETRKYFQHIYISDAIDPLDDQKITTLIITGEGGESAYEDSPSMIIRRKKNEKPEIYINWHRYLGIETIVTIRIGNTPAVTDEWNISTDSQASFYKGDVISFLNNIKATDNVVAKTTPYGDSPVTTIFNVSELKTMGEDYEWIFSDNNDGNNAEEE